MAKNQYTLSFEKPLLDLKSQISNLHKISRDNKLDLTCDIIAMKKKIETAKINIYKNLNAWQKVQLARHIERPHTLDYIGHIFDEFQELHGDRNFRDDPAMVGGIGRIQGIPVALVGTQKGRNTKDRRT